MGESIERAGSIDFWPRVAKRIFEEMRSSAELENETLPRAKPQRAGGHQSPVPARRERTRRGGLARPHRSHTWDSRPTLAVDLPVDALPRDVGVTD